jgi:hypothetical protein
MKLRLHLFSFMMLVSMAIFGQINTVGIIGTATPGGWGQRYKHGAGCQRP